MPKGTRVHDCVEKLMAAGMSQAQAIAICQKQTKQSFTTGKPLNEKASDDTKS